MKYDWSYIHTQRQRGVPWKTLAEQNGVKAPTLRGQYSRWLKTMETEHGITVQDVDEQQDETAPTALLTADDISRITTLEDLIEFFHVDTDANEVSHFRVNKWEVYSKKDGVTPLYQVRAVLGPNLTRQAEISRQIYEQARLDLLEAAENGPTQWPFTYRSPDPDGDPVMLAVAVFDPHLGMYAWEQEVGHNYDSSIGVADYTKAVDHALDTSRFYNVERILYIVGNDLAHVDGFGPDGRGGMSRGGATTSGTVQDFDSRLAKMFSTIRQAVVEGIDKARQIAPVDVVVIPGNHDEQTMYKLAEVLAAWYRNDPHVDVRYDPSSANPNYWPRRRQFYRYGENLLMLTHGMELKRKRDPLPLVMATEAEAIDWAVTSHREILTGHNHIRMTGGYYPEQDVTETRAIITRSLPGLTPEDAWHYNEGYKHQRGSTALIYRKSGGLAGLHEFTP
jgi:hypothetical protein